MRFNDLPQNGQNFIVQSWPSDFATASALVSSWIQIGISDVSQSDYCWTVDTPIRKLPQAFRELITGEQDFQRAAALPFVKKGVVVPYSADLPRREKQDLPKWD